MVRAERRLMVRASYCDSLSLVALWIDGKLDIGVLRDGGCDWMGDLA